MPLRFEECLQECPSHWYGVWEGRILLYIISHSAPCLFSFGASVCPFGGKIDLVLMQWWQVQFNSNSIIVAYCWPLRPIQIQITLCILMSYSVIDNVGILNPHKATILSILKHHNIKELLTHSTCIVLGIILRPQSHWMLNQQEWWSRLGAFTTQLDWWWETF